MVLLSSIAKTEFISLIKCLAGERIISKTGRAVYYNIVTDGKIITMDCDTRGTKIKISVDDLYKAYKEMDSVNTTELKTYIKGWVRSPACALLMAMKLYDEFGKRMRF